MMRLIGLGLTVFFYTSVAAQDNSPYSRYGLGDVVPNHNIVSRGMGSIAAGFTDFQTVNFTNPASYGNLSYASPTDIRLNPAYQRSTIFEFGAEMDRKTLKTYTPSSNFTSRNLVIPYIQMGFPIKMIKANKKGIFLGADFSLKPVYRINYQIAKIDSLQGVDSFSTVYNGDGGLHEVSGGLGIRIKNLSLGFNAGFAFGKKEYSTNLTFLSLRTPYFASTSSTNTNFNGTFFNAGFQYEIDLKNKSTIVLGGYGNLQQTLKGSQDNIRQTVYTDLGGEKVTIDSVFSNNVKGEIIRPSSFTVGFTYRDGAGHLLFGADYEATKWADYRFYGQPDSVVNNYKIKAGVEYYPASNNTPLKNYFSFVRYRFGFNFGPDYVKVNNALPEYGITFGAGFPLKIRRSFYETESSILNTAIEFGSRGNKNSNYKENTVRISIGFSMSDLWFRRYKYD